MDLDKGIEQQVGNRSAETIEELILDTCRATKVVGLDKFTNLKMLTLNGCGLTTLEGFPALPKLRCLELSDNQLSDGLENLQDAGMFELKRLSLAGNRFATLDSLVPLEGLPALRDLDLFNCAVTELPNYRSGIFEMLPNLKYLDSFDENEREKDEDDEDEEDEDDEADDDLLSSEVGDEEGLGEDDDSGLGEEDDDLGEEDDFGEEGSDDFGEEGDDDLGEEGEEGVEGEEGDFGEEDDDDGAEEEEDEKPAPAAKRQRR